MHLAMTRILVIDDDEQVREMLKLFLEYAGYDVLVAADGRAGMDLFHTYPVALVITDILMPEQEGLETIMALRQAYPAVRVIAMSGGGHLPPDQYLSLAGKLGANKTFFKPVDCAELLDAVREILHEPVAV
jgi:DNA-binding response OmpR family regulator